MIRIIIVDDHQMVRQGIDSLLQQTSEVSLVGEAETGQEAIDLVKRLEPDVVVMDISLPRMDGIQATRQIMALTPTPQIVALTMHTDAILVREMLHAGARGFVIKHAAFSELLDAIRAVHHGHMYLSPAISGPLFDVLTKPVSNQEDMTTIYNLLTPREQEVLQLIVEGHTNNNIAQLLSISPKTVEKHRANLMTKLNVNDMATLIRTAIKYKFVVP